MKVFDLKAFRKDKNITQKEIAPYGLLADKDAQIADLNRQIGKLEALLEVAKKGTAPAVGNATVADVG